MYETNMNTKMTFQNMTYALKIIDFFKSFVLWIKYFKKAFLTGRTIQDKKQQISRTERFFLNIFFNCIKSILKAIAISFTHVQLWLLSVQSMKKSTSKDMLQNRFIKEAHFFQELKKKKA